MRRVTISLTIGVTLSLHSGAAPAQEQTPQAYQACDGQFADTAAAKGAFQAGTAAFNEADYDRAITYWEDAYRRDCTAHALLKNLARAYELNGMFKHAILALRTYTERNPSSDETESLERRIANLRTKQAERDAPPVPVAQPAATPQASSSEPQQDFALDDFSAESSEGRSFVPLVVAGAGAALAGVGGVLWLGAKGEENAAAEKCPTRDGCSTEVAAAGTKAQDDLLTFGIVTWAGVGVLGGGLVWYFLQPETSDGAAIEPVVAPGFAGLNYSGSF